MRLLTDERDPDDASSDDSDEDVPARRERARGLNKANKAKKAHKDEDEEDDEEDEEEDGEESDEQEEQRLKKKAKRAAHPLLVRLPSAPEPSSAAVNRWFSDPIFAAGAGGGGSGGAGSDEDGEDEDDEDEDDSRNKSGEAGMPLTDKALRSAKRRKATERRERQTKRKESRLELAPGLEFVAPGAPGAAAGGGAKSSRNARAKTSRQGGGGDEEEEEEDDNNDEAGAGLEGLNESERAAALERRAQIRAGVGAVKDDGAGIEFVPSGAAGAVRLPPRADGRVYDSDNEEVLK